MIDLNPEIVQQIIAKAREFQAPEDLVMPEEDDSGDLATDPAEAWRGDPAFQQLQAAIDDLAQDQQIALVALMWVGRGDYGPDEWEAAVEQAEQEWTPRTAEYLSGTPLLADYLALGLEQVSTSDDDT